MPRVSVMRRVPSRSITAPAWMEKNIASAARIEIAMPIQKAVAPMSSAHKGIISVIIGIWLRLKNPVPNTAARPHDEVMAVEVS